MKNRIAIVILLLFCSCDDLMERDIRNDRVIIIAPYESASVPVGDIRFAWSNLDGAQFYHFTLVSPSFDKAVSLVADTIIPRDTTGRALYVNVELSRGVYQWKVTANNASCRSEGKILNLNVVDPQKEENE